ncbi:hypothetical protein PR202_gb28462 [Eleusine coracana subsp. coracana]|uniref:Uncharacterized protein n=1 Tax=Eleusine coracana subsp. coracana TaxID=191504 RepID=A0AAV5FX07_ELECO|nr:hypothetical protein QOZ80_6AG0550840 [Eleusine coracana subsp. coracana]GJN39351.1 hypothetical protein PR202_gb28462 [Eleusine coracana subsp. coracana]
MTPVLLPCPLPQLLHRKPILLHARRLGRVANAASNGNSSGDSSPAAADASSTDTASSSSDSKPAGIKNRLRARNQARRVQLDAPPEMVVTPKKKAPAATPRKEKQRAPKKWEEMSLAEKALELYVGEKGMLFWLNKFAYASIFIMVGAWILFRFVGPSLGFYQLDAPPLPPTAVFGS